MMVKRLLLNYGLWQQRNAEIPTFLSHDSSNGSMWVKIFDKNHFLVKMGGTQQECDYTALLKILERRSLRDDIFSDASSFFLKEKKKLCTIAI